MSDSGLTLAAVLTALQGPGINIAVGIILSFVVEYVPRFGQLAPRYKRLVAGLLCLVIPLLSCLAAVLLGYQADSLSLTWFPALEAGVIAFAATTLTHARKLSDIVGDPSSV